MAWNLRKSYPISKLVSKILQANLQISYVNISSEKYNFLLAYLLGALSSGGPGADQSGSGTPGLEGSCLEEQEPASTVLELRGLLGEHQRLQVGKPRGVRLGRRAGVVGRRGVVVLLHKRKTMCKEGI